MGSGEAFSGIIDVVHMKARHLENGEPVVEDVPAEYAERRRGRPARSSPSSIVEADDELMDEVPRGRGGHAGRARGASRQGHPRPCLCSGLLWQLRARGGRHLLHGRRRCAASPRWPTLAASRSSTASRSTSPRTTSAPWCLRSSRSTTRRTGASPSSRCSRAPSRPGIELTNARTQQERAPRAPLPDVRQGDHRRSAAPAAGDIVVVPKLEAMTRRHAVRHRQGRGRGVPLPQLPLPHRHRARRARH